MLSPQRIQDGGVHTWGEEQSRLVTWRDPASTRATVASMSGLPYWREVARSSPRRAAPC